MQPTDLDLELLEVLTLQVPWYMVCGDFHDRYGGAVALVERLKQLERAGLISLTDSAAPGHEVAPETLLADAARHDCYRELEDTQEPSWYLVATDAGFRLVEDRLGRQ